MQTEPEGIRRRWQDYSHLKQQVVTLLEKHPEGLTGAKISEAVGITQGAMSKYLSMIKVDGIITSRKVGVAKLWRLVSSSDRTGVLADKIGESQEATFKDYAISLLEENSRLYEADGKRVIVMPTMILTHLYKYTESILGTEVHAFFYEWGREYVKEVSQLVASVTEKTGIRFIESFLLLWKLKGWGKFEITSSSEESLEVDWHDSIWSEGAGSKNAPVDDFVSGALSAAASYSFGGNWRFSEAECKATGAQYCKFKGTKIV